MRVLLARGATLVALLLTAGAALAAPVDRRLADRLDSATAAEVWRIAETARAQGVPHESLVLTALEGASKGARRDQILVAVRERFSALAGAKEALGPGSSPGEVAAGAGALMSGVPRDTLVRLREGRPQGSLIVPLVVLADLVTRRVPIETASSAVLHASRSGARDADLLQLRSRVERDIQKGVSPAAATIARLQGLGLTPPGRARPRGATP